MALTSKLVEALARMRRRPRLRDRSVNQVDGARAPLFQEPMPADNPDDSIDPDDSGPRLRSP
jgi:hypothetical protein